MQGVGNGHGANGVGYICQAEGLVWLWRASDAACASTCASIASGVRLLCLGVGWWLFSGSWVDIAGGLGSCSQGIGLSPAGHGTSVCRVLVAFERACGGCQ